MEKDCPAFPGPFLLAPLRIFRCLSSKQLFGIAFFLCHSRVSTASGAISRSRGQPDSLAMRHSWLDTVGRPPVALSKKRIERSSCCTIVETQGAVRRSSCLVKLRSRRYVWNLDTIDGGDSTRIVVRTKESAEEASQL